MEREQHLRDGILNYADCNASCMGINSEGSIALLAGRKGFFLLNLDFPENSLKKTNRNNKWEPNVLEWNPLGSEKELFASVLNQKVEIWSYKEISSSPRCTLGGHTRVISDLNWRCVEGYHKGDLLTCSMDTYIYLWDLREHRRPVQTFTTVAGSSQVKWNKLNEHLFASAHDGDVRVWDTRKGNIPIVYVAGHLSKIHGLDWSPHNENSLVTASNDNTVKFWNIISPKHSKRSLNSGAPVWRARYTPFGNGLLTVVVPQLIQHGENNLLLWNSSELSSPIHTFSGHNDVILQFDWRSREVKGRMEYQLVTWSKDQTLRLWTLDPKIVKACHLGCDKEHTDQHHHHHHHRDDRENTASPATSPAISPTGIEIGIGSNSEFKRLELGSIKHDEDSDHSLRELEDAMSFHDKDGVKIIASQFEQKLKQEFSLISINNPIVSFEVLDAEQRLCTVAASIGPYMVKVHISFPSAYPNSIPPTFRFSKDTNLDLDVKKRLMRVLTDTSNSHVKYNRPCLEPCLRLLVQQIEELSIKDDLYESIVPAAPPLPPFYPNYPRRLDRNSFGSYQDPAVPFPRFSGARFCGVDKLVVFTRPARLNDMNYSGTAVTLRSLTALQAYMADVSVEDSFHTPTFGKSGSATSPRSKGTGVVIISDVSCLLPLHQSLGRSYMLSGESISDVCRFNANAAKAVGRKDLVKTWSLLSMVMDTNVESSTNIDESPWASHPFGRSLIGSLFNYYLKLRDVQTLAMLSCILSKQKLPDSTFLAAKSKRHYSVGSGFIPDSNSLHMCQVSPDFPYGVFRETSSSGSWSGLDMSIVERKPAIEDGTREYYNNCRLLDQSNDKQYDCFKKFYADILYRWNLLSKRTEVLKYVHEPPHVHRGLDVLVKCSSCCRSQRDPRCITCKTLIVQCAVCRIGVRGLLSFCVACGHGGHTLHLMEWFLKSEMCPSGCGCNCLKNGSITGGEDNESLGYYR